MTDDVQQLRRIGLSEAQAAIKAEMFRRADEALDGIGADAARWSIWVPGRLEVFGKHTDYAGGRSVLCAVERGFVVRAALRRDRRVRAVDVALQDSCDTSLDPDVPKPEAGWQRYVATVARRLARNFPSARRGVDLAFHSDLPIAAGMSSSSALMIAVFVSLAKSNDLRSSEEFRREIFSREELATYLGCIENGDAFRSLEGDGGVGTFGGSQDHTAIMCSIPGRLVQYGFRPVHREAVYRMPPTHTFVVASSGVVAEKTVGARDAYNRASRMVTHLVSAWNGTTGRADPTLADALRSNARASARLHEIARAETGPFSADELTQRLQQFELEALELIPAVGSALARGAFDELGPLSDRSQRAANEWLGNQVAETTSLARQARELGATAASAFGAGFGGSVWALVPLGAADTFAASWAAAHAAAFPSVAGNAEVFVSPAGPGAMQW
ncbi:MAG: galactokinase [Gemmatimonadaceae bacterium]|nr:galactokinase [Gemmatimonadaceae bacterium]